MIAHGAGLLPHLSVQGWATAASAATVAGGVVTVSAAIWNARFGRLVMRGLRLLAWLDPLHGVKRDLRHIAKELRPNGGSSLSDKVNAIWTRQGMTAARVGMLLDESDALLWQSDLDGKQVWASRALIEITGRPASELLGWGWTNVIHPADRERIRRAWMECTAEGRNFEERCRFQTLHGIRPGPEYSGLLVAKPFAFDGKIIAWIGRATIDPLPAPPAPPKPHRRPAR